MKKSPISGSFGVFAFCIFLLHPISINSRKPRKWEGALSFADDFDGFEVRKDFWTKEEVCHGKGRLDKNLECFVDSDDNLRILNGTLIIRSLHMPTTEMKLYGLSKNFTSGRLRTNGPGFSHGTFVISARMPKGRFLHPAIWLVPAYRDHENCKYEEIEIVQARGHKTSNLIFSASFGKRWNSVATKRMEKAFPGVDFSESFHEFAVVWKPRRIDWYVDGTLVFTASTYFSSDWILVDDSNRPTCGRDKSLFQRPLHLTLSLSVGGDMFLHEEKPLTIEEAWNWPKPTLEIDWVKIYQF